MRWKGRRRSSNVEYRGRRGGAAAGIGGGAVILGLIMYFMLGDSTVLQQAMQGQQTPSRSTGSSVQGTEAAAFVETVLATTEDVWGEIFATSNLRYQQPKMVEFQGTTPTKCGTGQSAMGPFYCPGDQTVYLDFAFFQQLARMGGPGDFAQAYVIGHEVAHHVQNITGVEPKMRQLQRRNPRLSNQLLVLLELQADCLAGVWANKAHTRMPILESGDIEEGLQAAASIGDDTIQRNAGQPIQPGKFTHGTSAQRVQWFKTGLSSGNVDQCDTWRDAGVQL